MVSGKNIDIESTKVNEKNTLDDLKRSKAEKLGTGLFFTLITAFGFLGGFGFSLSSTKKSETKNYSPEAKRNFYRLHHDGTELAKRALLRSSICNYILKLCFMSY